MQTAMMQQAVQILKCSMLQLQAPSTKENLIQLDWTPTADTYKINFPTNKEMQQIRAMDGKLSPRRIHWCCAYIWIAYELRTSWDLIGTTSYLGPISNLRPVMDSSAQTTRGNVLDFFVKPKNGISSSYTKRR